FRFPTEDEDFTLDPKLEDSLELVGIHGAKGIRVKRLFDALEGTSGLTQAASSRGTGRRQVQVPSRVRSAIRAAARETGVSERLLTLYAYIESSFNPRAGAGGRYVGLFQLSTDVFSEYGGRGSRTDPVQNALVAARSIKAQQQQADFPRDKSNMEQAVWLYVMHQQGAAGGRAHYRDQEQVAWRNIRRYYRSDRTAQRVVRNNVSTSWFQRFGINMTSKDFIGYWASMLGRADRLISGSW
ncbi:MAG: transglycosylase SLT domain-containing protein, partial [Myxococcota bacterium]